VNRSLLTFLLAFITFSGVAQNEQTFPVNQFIVDNATVDMPFGVESRTFNCKTTLGFNFQTEQCGTCKVQTAKFGYRVYKTGDSPPDFSVLDITPSPEGTQNILTGCTTKTWNNPSIEPLILQNLQNGTYQLDIYFQSDGTDCDPNPLRSAEYSTTFTYNKEPIISFQPIDLVNCSGQDMFFKTEGIGIGTITYQWERSDNGGTFVALGASTRYVNPKTKTLKVNNIITDNHDDTFRCVLTDGNGCSVTVRAASAFVSRKRTIISTANTICEGGTNSLTSRILEGTVKSYQWEYEDNITSNFVDLSDDETFNGTTNAELQVSRMPKSISRYQVKMHFNTVEINDDGSTALGTCVLKEDETFTINPRPEKPTISNVERCGNGVVDLIAPLDTTGYRWYADTLQAASSTAKIYSPNLAATQSLFFSYLNDESCESHRTEFTAIVNPISTISLSPVSAICPLDESFPLPYTDLTGGGDEYSITSPDFPLFSSVTGVAISATPLVITVKENAAAGTYNFVLKLKNLATECESPDIPFTVRVKAPTVITTQPDSTKACEDEAVSFSVVATGEGTLMYQWFKDDDKISGEESAILSLASVTSTTAGSYSCQVTAESECDTITSEVAELLVYAKTTISQQPQNVIECEGNSATFTVAATGEGTLKYQWKKNGANIGTNSDSLTINGLQNSDNNAQITCKVTSDKCGGLTSTAATLTVIPLPNAPTVISPTGFCKAETATPLTATPAGGNSLLWWGNDVTGGTSSANAPTPATASVGSTNYYVSQQDANGCEGTRAKIEVVISAPITVGISPTKTSICATGVLNKIAVLQAFPSAGNGTFTYQWSNSSGIIADENDSLIVANSAETYTVEVTSAYCSATENQAINSVLPELVNAPSATDVNICYQETATLSAGSDYNGGSFRWYDVAEGTAALSSINPLVLNNLVENRTVFVAYQKTTGITACETPRKTVNVTVNPQLVISAQPQSVTKCKGNTANFTATITNAASYQWQRKLPDGTFENLTGENAEGLRISSIGNSANPHLTKYRLIASSGSCSVTTNEVTLFVNSKDANLDSQTACLGSDVTFSVPATTGTIQSYQWQKRTGSSGSFEEVIGKTEKDLFLGNVSLAEDNTFYRCRLVFDNGDGSTCIITTDDGRLTVRQVSISLTKEDAKCFGGNTGSITATASGSSGYAYQLGSGTFQASNKFDNLLAGLYTVYVKDGDGCTATENTTIAEPAKIAISNLITTPATCDGATGSISFTALGGTGALKFKLGNGDFQTNPTFSNLSGGTYDLTTEDENGCLLIQSGIVVGGKAVPLIITQPINLTNCEGNTATFEITASNAANYQWQQQLPGGNFVNITGENTSELRLTNVGNSTNPHLAKYRVLLQNDGCEVISEIVTLNVNSVSGSTEDKTLCEGADYTLDLTNYTLTGTVSAYQWQYRSGTSGSWNDLPDGANNSLTLSNLQESNSGYYRCRITFQNSSGTCIEYNETGSGLKVEVVGNTPPVISTDKTIMCDGESATLTVFGCSGGTVKWSTGATTTIINVTVAGSYTATCKFDNCESLSSVRIAISQLTSPVAPVITTNITEVCGTEKATFSATTCIGSIKWSDGNTERNIQVGAGKYTAVCENICGASPVSNEITITEKDVPDAPIIASDKTSICKGETTTLTAVGCIGDLEWSTGETVTQIIVGIGFYKVVCFNSCGRSDVSEINISNAFPTGGTIEATAAINCAGYNPPTIQNSADPTGEDLIIQWQQHTTSGDWTDIDGANSLTYNPSALSDTTLYRRKVSNRCGEVFSNVDTIYIAPDPGVIVTSAKSLICSNESFTLNAAVIGGSGNCPISWQRNNRSSALTSSFWEDISGTTEALTINDLSNAASENTLVYYRAVVDCQPSSCNKATADAFEITVQPSFDFALNFTDSTICEGNSLEVIATGCGGTISWLSGESTSSITVSPISSISYTATCTNSCGSSTETANVVVLPGGVALPVNNTPLGVVTPAVLTFAATGTNLKWYDAESGGTGALTPPSFTELGTYTYWVTQSDGRCESNRLKITSVIYPPLALNTQSGNQYDCKGNSVNYSVNAVGAGKLVYQWQRKRPDETEFTNLTEDGNGIKFFYGPVLRVSAVGNGNNPHLSEYRCLVRDSLGGVFSDKMILYVNSLEGTFKNIGACIGTNYDEDIKIKFRITGDVSAYQWQSRSGTSGPWDDMTDTDRIKGTLTSRLQISPLEYTDGNMYYRCSVTFNTGRLTCTENTDPSRLVVSGYPNAPVSSTVEYCQFDRAKRLSYKTGSSNGVLWYLSENQLEGDTKAPTPETREAGEFKVYFTEATPQGCESPRSMVQVKINAEPAPPKNTTPEFVKEGTVLEFTAEGENLKWYTSRTGRTHTTATPTYANPKLYKHYVSQTSQPGCESGRTYVEAVIREALKLKKAPVAQADCDGNSVTFDANADSFSDVTYQWERKQPDETDFGKIAGETERRLNIRDVGENGNINGTLYRCLVKDAEDSLFTTPVPLIVNQVIGEIPDVVFCTGQQIALDSTKIKTTGLVERYEWQRQSGRSWFTIDSTSNWLNLGIADSSKTADFRLKAVFKVNDRLTCNRYSPEVKVVVNPVPVAPVTTDYAVCKFTEQKLKIEPLEKGNQVLWFTSLTDNTGKTEPPQNLSETVGKKTFYVAERSKKGCESERTALNFTTIPPPQKPVTDSLLNVCQFASNINLAATAQNDLLWSVKTADDFTEERPGILTQSVGTQQFYVTAIDTNGCLSENQRIAVSVQPCIVTIADVNPEECNVITQQNVSGNSWVNFYNSAGKLFGAINPSGQNLGTVTLRFQLSGKKLNTPEGTALFSRYFALESSLLEKFERPVQVRVFAQNGEINSFTNASEWFVTHYEGINEDCDPLNNDNFVNGRSVVIYGDVSVNDFTSDITDFFEFATNSFSEFGLTDNPFSRIKTNVSVVGNKVAVALNITDEVRPLRYLIERSIDGINWFSWWEINAGEPKQLIDGQPFSGKSYYRTIYQDLDGTLKYFEPVSVDLEIAEPVCVVFPNPVIKGQTIKLYVRNLEPVTFEFFDAKLRKWGVAVNNTEPNNYELMLSTSLAHGTYFVRATDSEEKSCVVKIVKR
jgi:hypothetical protein